jgi:hypothetical protein
MAELIKLVSEEAEYVRPSDVIITNLSVPSRLRSKANDHGWELVHHFKLHDWMRTNYHQTSAQPMGPAQADD